MVAFLGNETHLEENGIRFNFVLNYRKNFFFLLKITHFHSAPVSLIERDAGANFHLTHKNRFVLISFIKQRPFIMLPCF